VSLLPGSIANKLFRMRTPSGQLVCAAIPDSIVHLFPTLNCSGPA
jgi:hypothetical protein